LNFKESDDENRRDLSSQFFEKEFYKEREIREGHYNFKIGELINKKYEVLFHKIKMLLFFF
jgi:hypothetical protein